MLVEDAVLSDFVRASNLWFQLYYCKSDKFANDEWSEQNLLRGIDIYLENNGIDVSASVK